ncbi:MAG TPA: hypothetical protein VM432_05050, partial [Bdellovibrionales bacterium]|nr:hypothetical protein [Bdellovibrionales bacterium]
MRPQLDSVLRSLVGLITLSLLAISMPSLTKAQPVERSSTYVSQIDSDLTIRRVTLLPVSDNIEGIYARPIEAQLLELIKGTHRWDFVESGLAAPAATLIELEEKPTLVQQALAASDADATFAASATRGPSGL